MTNTPDAAVSLGLPDAIRLATRDRLLYLILAIFVGLGLAWNFVTPVFETPDEPDHLQYILFVEAEGRRPDLRTDVARAGIESPQPPLYYLLAGYLLRLSGGPHLFTHPTRNPDFSFIRMESAPRYFLPLPDTFDYVHLLRALSTVFGLATVLCTYLAAIILGAPQSLARIATAVTAFLPQFTFNSASISNDPLTSALAAIGFVWLLTLLQSRGQRLAGSAVFGVLAALAFLTKSHAIFLLPFGLLMLLVVTTNWKNAFMNIAASLCGFAAVAGPYLLYNLWRYGDPTAVNMQVQIVPELVVRQKPLELESALYFAILLPSLMYRSFLGVFGWMRIFLPTMIYAAFGFMWLAALIGMANAIKRNKWDQIHKGLIFAPLFAFLVIAYVNLTFIAPQGRYLFPAIGAISLVFVFGLAELPTKVNRLLLGVAPLFLLVTNFYSLWLVWSTLGQP